MRLGSLVNDHLPLFLNDEDYAYLERRLAPDSLKSMVESQYKTMLTPAGMVAQQFIRKDPFGLTFSRFAQTSRAQYRQRF